MSITKYGWTAYLLALAILVLDQVSKHWIVSVLALPVGATHPVFAPLQFTRIWNEGVSFGLFQAGHELVRWGFVAFSIVVAALLGAWAARQIRLLPALGLGLVMGGAVGNAIDRARYGAVVDFIDVQRIGFFPWIFNVADSAITVGVVLLLLDSMRRERPAAGVGADG
jgi:signal peptidase II